MFSRIDKNILICYLNMELSVRAKMSFIDEYLDVKI
jgi:hypothetical protein